MWRYTRVFLAALCFSGFVVLFVDASGTVPPYLSFLATLQIVPAFLSGSVCIVALLAGLTLLLGRVYCSVLCPLGVLQDIISRCGGRRRFGYRAGKNVLRALVLAAVVASLVAGVPIVLGLLDPYSAFGRIATDMVAPLWGLGSNALADVATRLGSVAIAATPVWQKGLSALAGAVVTLMCIAVLAWHNGRTWCNTLCPVGTLLGLLGRFALVRPRIRTGKCAHCGLCATVCKASCIDAAEGRIDASRCVACCNCQGLCRHNALTFTPWGGAKATATQTNTPAAAKPEGAKAKPMKLTTGLSPSTELTTSTKLTTSAGTPAPIAAPFATLAHSRRALLLGLASGFASGLVTLPAQAAARGQDVVIRALTRKERPSRAVPITPAGSISLKHYAERCTGCQLCVSACPHQALRAQDTGLDMLQPTLSFEHGFCRVNCVVCSTMCPTGAIRPITVEEKSATQIGRVSIKPELCIVHTDKVACTACTRNCPPGAITLVGEGELKVPAVDNERCTGCGACEYLCPARPFAAIRVEGNREHRRI